jgi:hypothetical protein
MPLESVARNGITQMEVAELESARFAETLQFARCSDFTPTLLAPYPVILETVTSWNASSCDWKISQQRSHCCRGQKAKNSDQSWKHNDRPNVSSWSIPIDHSNVTVLIPSLSLSLSLLIFALTPISWRSSVIVCYACAMGARPSVSRALFLLPMKWRKLRTVGKYLFRDVIYLRRYSWVKGQ